MQWFKKSLAAFVVAFLFAITPALATTYYVSNATNNGYQTGNDANTCLSVSVPCLTIAHAISLTNSSGADTVQINPGTGAYVENSGSSYLDSGVAGVITGDPTLCGSGVTPTSVPTIQSTAASRVIDMNSRTFSQTLACVNIDAENSASRVGVNVQINPLLTLQQVNIINIASGAAAVSNINASAGNSGHTYDRLTLNSTVAASSPFGWFAATKLPTVTFKGGVFGNSPGSRQIWFSGTFTTVIFQADVNNALPTFTGTTGATAQIRFTSSTTTSATIAAVCTGTKGCIQIDGGTITNFTIQNSRFTDLTADEGIRIVGATCTLGQINNNTFVSGATRGFATIVAENCNITTQGNVANPSATNTGPLYNWVAGTAFTSTNDTCNIPTNSARICFLGGANGWFTDASNTGASTGSQNLGDLIANTFVDQFWTTAAATSSSRAPYLAAIDLYLKKTGSPVGNVTVSIYADSAGSPTGAALATSAAIAAASLTTSIQQFHFTFATPLALTAATKYHAVVTYSGSISLTDFVVLDRNSTTTIGSILTAALIGGPWVADATHALRIIVQTGYYNTTMTYVNPVVRFADSTDTRELEGVTSGPINGLTVSGLICTNCGYPVVVKNTLGNSYVYNSMMTAYAVSATTGFYAKAAANVQFWHNTCILGASVTGQCAAVDADSLSAVNPIQSSNPTIKDNIWKTFGTSSAAYSIGAGTTGSILIDYNDVALAGTTIDKTTVANWATWQGLGYDTHSIQADPRLRNQRAAFTFNDITPLRGSPVIGAGITTGSPTTRDALGIPFSPPTMGAIQFRNSCSKHAGRSLCP